MKTKEEYLADLNCMIRSESFNTGEFISTITLLENQFNAELKLLDFTFYNEERLQYVRKQKMVEVKNQNFEVAAQWREKQQQCNYYIELRQTLASDKSLFYFEGDYLCYFYFNNCRNDKAAFEIFTRRIKKRNQI